MSSKVKGKLHLIQPAPSKRGTMLGSPIWILEAVYLINRVTSEVPVLRGTRAREGSVTCSGCSTAALSVGTDGPAEPVTG